MCIYSHNISCTHVVQCMVVFEIELPTMPISSIYTCMWYNHKTTIPLPNVGSDHSTTIWDVGSDHSTTIWDVGNDHSATSGIKMVFYN